MVVNIKEKNKKEYCNIYGVFGMMEKKRRKNIKINE
jgi:hypothetical protein